MLVEPVTRFLTPGRGRVLIASLGGLTAHEFAECLSIKRGACRIPFRIVALDPDPMTIVETLYETDGAPMGAGTFRGDRILRVNLKEE